MGACLVSGRGGPSQLDSAGRASRRRGGGRRVASPHGARLAAALRAAVGGGKFHQRNEARGGTVVACPPVGATIDRSLVESRSVFDPSLGASKTDKAFQQSNIIAKGWPRYLSCFIGREERRRGALRA